MQTLKLLSVYLFFWAVFSGIAQAQQETVVDYQNGVKYEGEVVDGQPNGMGTMTFPSGEIYQGRFAAGLLQGTAILTKPDGSSFIGDYNDHSLVGELRPLASPSVEDAQDQRTFAGCLDAYEEDLRLGEMILQINRVYGNQISNVSRSSARAWADGTANATSNNAGQAMAQGAEASRPYNARVDQLVAERNYKTSDLRYQREVLKAANPGCRLL